MIWFTTVTIFIFTDEDHLTIEVSGDDCNPSTDANQKSSECSENQNIETKWRWRKKDLKERGTNFILQESDNDETSSIGLIRDFLMMIS